MFCGVAFNSGAPRGAAGTKAKGLGARQGRYEECYFLAKKARLPRDGCVVAKRIEYIGREREV